ncbi:hypothetical protein PR202_ga20519 [Eleusine coracana subsp. coracana]|uniref:glycerophosphodiester phosphodiesterase n=1 Tax=Eleusine coracana subsp. coracana TaxID=191504 RepID=A0AAV5CXY4_ELECO|nr:hypothetical protein PR202_ga20519 [Eleusine coracana subsp. coracana]
MAQLKAAEVPCNAAAPDMGGAQLDLASACVSGAADVGATSSAGRARPPLVVVGHRGKGMNARLRGDVRENTLRSFNDAARCPGVGYVEFDVQVTKDGCPVIFHDIFIYTQQDGEISGKRVTDLSLDEFLSYGAHKDHGKAGKPLLRKLKEDGSIVRWDVRSDDALCTLRDAFQGVDRRVGFNVELKFDDDAAYTEDELAGTLQAVLKACILPHTSLPRPAFLAQDSTNNVLMTLLLCSLVWVQVVFENADARPIIFSSFHPDAALLMRKLQDKYPVYFLTKGGTEVFADARRNSLEAAVGLCLAGGLQGIVSEVRAILRQPSAVAEIKDAQLSLLTYGQLNNVPEVVCAQHLLGVDGVIVDLVREIAEAVSAFTAARDSGSENAGGKGDDNKLEKAGAPSFSHREISLLLKLIPELVQ